MAQDPKDKQISDLQNQIKSLEGKMSGFQTKAEASRTPSTTFDIESTMGNLNFLQEGGGALGKVISSALVPENILADFVASTNVMENAAQNLAMKFASGRDMVTTIKKTIDLATPSVKALGGDMQDVVDIQRGAIDALGKQVVLDKEAYADVYAVGNLINDGAKMSATQYADLFKNFKNLGYSIYDVSKQMSGVIDSSREIGVAASAVYSQLTANLDKLNIYNFDKGVKGMAEMAAQAATMRVNMSATFDFAEKVFKPEDAMEMAANMQRLGVSVSNLLDPFKMMDMAQNRPEELQKSLMEAAKEFVRFDEQQQRFVVTDQRRLREYADTIGKSAQEVAQMGINFADMDRKMKVIDFGKDIVNDKDKQFFAGLAELKDGKYMVNVGLDDHGEPMLKELNQLTKEDRDRLRKKEAEKKLSPAELQIETLHSMKRIELLLAAQQGIVGRHLAASQFLESLGQKTEQTVTPMIKATSEEFGIKEKDGRLDVMGAAYTLDDVGVKMQSTLEKIIKDPTKGLNTLMSEMGNAGKYAFTGLQNLPETITRIGNRAKEIAKEQSAKAGGTKEVTNYDEAIKKFFQMMNINVPSTSTAPPSTSANINPTETPTGTGTGSPNMILDGITTQSKETLIQAIQAGMEGALTYYSSSPALSVSLWGDKIGMTDNIKQVKEGIDKNTKDQKEIAENSKSKITPPSTTTTNITNENILKSMAEGKLSDTARNILEKNKETESKEYYLNEKLIDKKLTEKLMPSMSPTEMSTKTMSTFIPSPLKSTTVTAIPNTPIANVNMGNFKNMAGISSTGKQEVSGEVEHKVNVSLDLNGADNQFSKVILSMFEQPKMKGFLETSMSNAFEEHSKNPKGIKLAGGTSYR